MKLGWFWGSHCLKEQENLSPADVPLKMKFHFEVSSFRKKVTFPSILFNPKWGYTYFFSHSENIKEQEKLYLMSLPLNKFFIIFEMYKGNHFGNGSYYFTIPWPKVPHSRFCAWSDSGTFGQGMVKKSYIWANFHSTSPY